MLRKNAMSAIGIGRLAGCHIRQYIKTSYHVANDKAETIDVRTIDWHINLARLDESLFINKL